LANNTYRTEFIIENLKINLNILESCIENNNIKIVNLGSSCIYPLDAENPISENSFMKGELEPTNSPYAMAKISAIEIGRSMNKQYNHKIINLMPTNLYGPNDNFSENESHVIPGLMHKMHTAKKNNDSVFKIWGSGKPLREFLHVDDLSSAIEYILLNNIETDLLNIGSGEEISILDLAGTLKDVIEYEGSIELDLDKPDGNPRKLLDSSKINNLGWKSEINLVDGLKKTYSWYLENIA
jgi:GDP-L-fucose synthase